jgi:hypothetical protein
MEIFRTTGYRTTFFYRIEFQIPLSLDVSFLLVYTTIADNCINYSASNDHIVLAHELEIMWSDAVMAYFKPLHRYLFREIRKNYEEFQ